MNEQSFDKYECISLINKTKDELFKENEKPGCNSTIYNDYYNSNNN